MSFINTVAIRGLARRIDNVAEQLSTVEKTSGNKIGGINGDMQGDTAKAIDTAVDDLCEELRSISSGLARCADSLYRYARNVEAADRESKNVIGSR